MHSNNRGYIDTLVVVVTFILVFMAAVFLVIIGVPGGVMSNYSTGARTGIVNKSSHRGLLFKSWEGEVNMGGMRDVSTGEAGHTNIVANIYEFSVTDNKVAQEIQEALDSGRPVKLSYHQYLVKPFGLSTSYVIDKVDALR